MGKNEAAIQTEILDFLESKGFLVMKFHNGAYKVKGGFIRARASSKGIPDIIGMTPDGRFVGVEVKVPGEHPTDEQSQILRRINNSGGVGILATSVDDVVRVLVFRGIIDG